MRILLVEDQDQVREILADALLGEGHEVIAAATSQEAEERLRASGRGDEPGIDAVLTDFDLGVHSQDTGALVVIAARHTGVSRRVIMSGRDRSDVAATLQALFVGKEDFGEILRAVMGAP